MFKAITLMAVLAAGSAYANDFYYKVDVNRDCPERKIMETKINETLFSKRPKTMEDAIEIANKELGKSGCRIKGIEEKTSK